MRMRGLWAAAVAAGLAAVVAGLAAGRAAGAAGWDSPASSGGHGDPEWRSRIEADWRLQDEVRRQKTTQAATTREDAAGGCDGVKTGKWGFHTQNENEPRNRGQVNISLDTIAPAPLGLRIMARFARVVIPGVPYHVTHRGNRREDVFLAPDDRRRYLAWLGEYARRFDLAIWAYCLMTNHVHLLVVPGRADSLALAVGRTHRRHARAVNAAHGWSGHLWANRFYSAPLDEPHLWAAVRYVETNPVRAGLVERAEDYTWSSAPAHAAGRADPLLAEGRPFTDRRHVADWRAWLAEGADADTVERLRTATRTGRPCGAEAFVAHLERLTERILAPLARGRKKKAIDPGQPELNFDM
jgi:putative transposase